MRGVCESCRLIFLVLACVAAAVSIRRAEISLILNSGAWKIFSP